ncbi:hypothetical protein BH10ACI1_BH10ACI1_05440 [soil metagenome]
MTVLYIVGGVVLLLIVVAVLLSLKDIIRYIRISSM